MNSVFTFQFYGDNEPLMLSMWNLVWKQAIYLQIL